MGIVFFPFSPRDSPPRVENCSPNGPVARHMSVDAPGTRIGLGSSFQQELHQSSAGFPPNGSVDREKGNGSNRGMRWDPILRDPVNVKVSVTSMSTAEKGDAPVKGGAGFKDFADGIGSGNRRGHGGGVPEAEGFDERGARGVVDAGDASVARVKVAEERTMSVSVGLSELSLALKPEARAALIECVGKNILAAGFHGDVSENFPWTRAGGELLPSSREEDGFGHLEDCATECAVCNSSFDELVARHRCAWCRGSVCRGCMQTPVRLIVIDLCLSLLECFRYVRFI